MILAGDVGGTKTNLGLFKKSGGKLKAVREGTFPSQGFPSLPAMIAEFLSQGRQKVHACAVGVAGPVVHGRSHVVNLRWPVDGKRLAKALGLKQAAVLNDLEANAWGIPELTPSKLVNLTPGLKGRGGNRALIAAGTGLGMAFLIRDGDRFIPSASEGGHQEFGPRNDLEIELLKFMRRRHGRVSTERIVAGPGFTAIYQFLLEQGWGKESRAMSRRLAEVDDTNAEISRVGVDGDDAVAVKTVELFVSLYGSAAGDLALVSKATDGLYVGGGIAPKILPKLKTGEFVEAFCNKGRLSPVLEKIPIRVIVEPRTALIGAAACAARMPKR